MQEPNIQDPAPSTQLQLLEDTPLEYPVHSSAEFWPNDHKFRDQLSIPLTLGFCPLEMPAQQASFAPNRINSYRCHSCKAFPNYLCVIRSENQYDCSICGCTNRVPVKLDRESPEFTTPIYSCLTTNPTHRQNSLQDHYRTFIFVFDVTAYEEGTTCNFNHYAAEAIKQFCQQVESGEHPPCKVSILAFNDYIHEYSVDPQGQVSKVINTHMEELMSGESLQISLPGNVKQVQQILADVLNLCRANEAKMYKSLAFLKAIENIFLFFHKKSGKLFVVSGLRSPPGLFLQGILEEPEQFQNNFTLNKKKCLPAGLGEALETTQLSASFYLYNNNFINALPLYAITKTTNGELKSYLATNFSQFYYQFSQALCEQSWNMGSEAILKVRHSSGLKLVGIFGQYRHYKGSKDQVELLSCPSTRNYMFEFVIEGKVQQTSLTVQFSILWTDQKGNRVFKVVTHNNKLSGDCKQIIRSVNYNQVNSSYLQAVLHNMQLNVRVRNLQLTLQQRCRKHIKAIQKYEGEDSEAVKKAQSYIIFTFFLMRHFIMNTQFCQDYVYDKCIEMKSRILTSDASGIHHIWPAVYAVSYDSHRIADMRYQDLKQATQAVVIDQGSYCYLYICNNQLRDALLKKNKLVGTKTVMDLVLEEEQQMKQTVELLEEIKEHKLCGYIQLVLMESLQGACIFDERGPLSYSSFLDIVTAE